MLVVCAPLNFPYLLVKQKLGGLGGLPPSRAGGEEFCAFRALDFACFLHHQVLLSRGLLILVLQATLDFRAYDLQL